MVATAFGPLIMILFPLAGSSNDLVSLIHAEDYFKTRQIEVKVERMVELAGKKPEGSADRIAQLLAIRWLGQHPDEVKKARNARDVLGQVAEGKLAQDPQGFAKEYARRALARLDGKPLPLEVVGDDSLQQALAWMPDGVSFAYAVSARSRLKEPLLDDRSAASLAQAALDARRKEMIYNFADTVGNVRVDRLAIGMTVGPNERPDSIYVRFSGLADRELLAKYLFAAGGAKGRNEVKGPNGEPITLLEFGEREPAVAIVGSGDVIVAGREQPMKDSRAYVNDMLDVRAGKKASALKGSLARVLKDAPAGASVLLGGKVPNEFSRMLVPPRGPLPGLPKDGLFSLVVGPTIEMRLTGKLDSAEEAKGFAEAVAMLKQHGQAALKQPGLPLGADAIAVFQKALDSVKVETAGDQVSISAQAKADAAKALYQVLEKLMESRPEPLPDGVPLPPR